MTIGVGFKCSDGVILAADTKYTKGDFKGIGPKIFIARENPSIYPMNNPSLSMVIAGAGHVGFMKRAVDFIRDRLSASNVTSIEGTRVLVEDELSKFYGKHVYRNPKFPDLGDFELLIGGWSPEDNDFYLFRSSETTLTAEDVGPETIGAGAPVSDYALKRLAG